MILVHQLTGLTSHSGVLGFWVPVLFLPLVGDFPSIILITRWLLLPTTNHLCSLVSASSNSRTAEYLADTFALAVSIMPRKRQSVPASVPTSVHCCWPHSVLAVSSLSNPLAWCLVLKPFAPSSTQAGCSTYYNIVQASAQTSLIDFLSQILSSHPVPAIFGELVPISLIMNLML